MQDFRMETFLTVCKFMNYTYAAKELNLTQPAVSQHIHFLEKEYQVALFEKKGKKVILTKQGEILRNAALTMMHDEIHLKNILKNTSNCKNYSFGATLTVAEFILPPSLTQVIQKHPDWKLTMKVANTEQLLSQIDSGELDFAIIEGNYLNKEYDSYEFQKCEYVAVACPELVSKLTNPSLSDLLPYRLFTREQGSGTREILEVALKNRGIQISDFAMTTELGNIGAIKEMLKNKLGIAFLYHAAIMQEEAEKILLPIPLTDFSFSHSIQFVYRKDSIFKEEYKHIFQEFKM